MSKMLLTHTCRQDLRDLAKDNANPEVSLSSCPARETVREESMSGRHELFHSAPRCRRRRRRRRFTHKDGLTDWRD